MQKIEVQSLGESPTVFIEQLQKELNVVIGKSRRVTRSKRFNEILEKMDEIFVKLNMAKLIQDRRIVSITGLQGVGKTKLVRDLYDLPDDLLPSTPGVGEIIPVLFTEKKGIIHPTYFVRKAVPNKVSGLYELEDIEITLEELNAKSRDYEENEQWLEVLVPQKHFNTDISLALLPGFERNKQEKSQKYLELFLTLSTSAVLVVNHKKLAQKPQQLLLDKISRAYKENAPIFVLSFAEELEEEQRKTIRDSISAKFDVAAEEQDRITFTGIAEEINSASQLIVDAIIKYGLTTTAGYQKQLDTLMDLASSLDGLIVDLEEELKHEALSQQLQFIESNSNKGNNINEITEAFNSYRKRVVAKANNEIEKVLTNHAGKCSDKMDQKLKGEQLGVWLKFKANFMKEMTFEQRIQLREDLREIWHGESSYEAEKKVIYSLENYIKEATIKLEDTNKHLYLDQPKSGSNELSLSNDIITKSLSNIERYLNPENEDITITPQDLEVLPIIAVGIAQEMLVASLVYENEALQKSREQLDEKLIRNILEEAHKITDDINNLSLSTSNVIKGAAVFFGIDAIDGTFNSFGALTSILTALGASSAAATPIGLAIVGAVGTGLAVNQGAQRIEKYKFERSIYAKETFNTVASIQRESTVAMIENILEEMEEKLVQAYHKRRGTNETFGLFEELEGRLHRLQLTCGKLQELAFRNAPYIH
ncbi:hypothetical protein SAMN05192533_12519 [Mesobacillus persicus]|uniref:Uncharacterized protein n=1 Tax=Mesobacillus persicus TaxID=930146 RepID=A0A1H8K849_9BACI|nr:hypothetical protein [Mesobacillus persicus]SEN88887.1 hypothetical protein SAMN05192533_12519 [Mesobacillus persicus]